ncbi:MAG: hypothetical protein A2X48_16865 [Lentisphaerae bacterium GWF2_49_21]|nr:MAG: hypothetical protein A2X48_16865 [Lentisphaerae bacterium GWF2_49_21]
MYFRPLAYGESHNKKLEKMIFAQIKLHELYYRIVVLGEPYEKATPKEIKYWMSFLCSMCVYTLTAFHFSDVLEKYLDKLDKINLYLPAIPALLFIGIVLVLFYLINHRILLVIGPLLFIITIIEIIIRSINI